MAYQRRFFRVILMLLLFLCLAGPVSRPALAASQADGSLPPDLQALIEEALKANTEVKKMRAVAQASKETIRPAGTLDDPNASFSISNLPTDTWSFSEVDMTQKIFDLSQKFPFPGKLRLRSEVAVAQYHSDEYSYRDTVNEVRAKMEMAYWGLSKAFGIYDLTQKNKQTWEEVVKVAETRYGVGQVTQADVLQAQVELGNYLDRLFQWAQREESIKADINSLRSRPPKTPVPRPQPLKARPLTLKLDELLAQAKARPELEALKALIAKQEKAVDLAKKDYYPDVTIGVSYGLRENSPTVKRADFFSTRFMINLPIWQASKIKPRIREAEARQEAAKDAHQSAWNQVAAALKDRYAKLQRLASQIALFNQGIIPQARQAAAASLTAYQVGTLRFNQLYQNEIAVYNAEIQLQEYLGAFEENWAELEWLVGAPLPRSAGGRK